MHEGTPQEEHSRVSTGMDSQFEIACEARQDAGGPSLSQGEEETQIQELRTHLGIPVHPERRVFEEEDRRETIEQLFCGKLQEQDARFLYERGLHGIEQGLTGISPEHLEKFSEKFIQDNTPQADEGEDDPLVSGNRYAFYNTYRMLRDEGFSHEEIAKLCESTMSGQLETILSREITSERILANEFVARNGDNIARVDEVLTDFVGQVRGKEGTYQKPQSIFTGKYQNLMVFTGNSIDDQLTPRSASLYSTGENVVLVNIKNLSTQGEFDDTAVSSVLHTYVHEHVHSIGANTIEKGDAYRPLDPTSGKKLLSGFFHSSEEGGTYLLSNINEGTTEYFARRLSERAGLEGYQGTYQPQVESLERLFAFLEEGHSGGQEERERVLRRQYSAENGVESLRAQLESEIGPHALEVCDILFDTSQEFNQFLSSLRKTKQGEEVREELWISAQRIQSTHPEISLLEIQQAYPFLHLGVRTYDEASQSIIWKEIPSEHSSQVNV